MKRTHLQVTLKAGLEVAPTPLQSYRPPVLRVVCLWKGYLLLGAVNQLVLVGALIAGADAFILPQSLGVLVEFLKMDTGKTVER